jgi:zinc transport system permease protein
MNLLDYLADPVLAWPLVYRPLIVAAALVVMSGVLSVLVVVKRLSFAGQGISHSAFGGVGVAAVCGVLFSGTGALHPALEFGLVLLFCAACALAMAHVSDRRRVQMDTGIGLLLVAAMALGGVLVDVSRHLAEAGGVVPKSRSWESVLFGSIQVVGPGDAWTAWGVCAGVLLVLWCVRRPLLFWAVDEPAAQAFGVPVRRVRGVLMVLLALAVVTSMKLAGVVPATALLVLPGAIALRVAGSLIGVIVVACAVGLMGLVVAMVLALQLNVQAGPSLVLVLTGAFFATYLRPARRGKAPQGPTTLSA